MATEIILLALTSPLSLQLTPETPFTMVLYEHPTSVLGTHLGRCCHADFWNKVVLKETDDVLLL